MHVLVTGGTGTLGQHLARQAADAGHRVRIMSRRPRPDGVEASREWARADLGTGEGVPGALHGVDAVLHAATKPGLGSKKVDVEGTRRLVKAARDAGIQHLLYPSIVGIDDIPFSYYQHKREAERIITGSSVPHTILRATQFHAFVDQIITALNRFFVLLLPTDFQVQSVAAREVGARLVQGLSEGPSGRLDDFGGPEVLTLEAMTETWLEVHAQRRRIVHLPLPGRTARGFRQGTNTAPDHRHGTTTWKEWLQQGAVNK